MNLLSFRQTFSYVWLLTVELLIHHNLTMFAKKKVLSVQRSKLQLSNMLGLGRAYIDKGFDDLALRRGQLYQET